MGGPHPRSDFLPTCRGVLAPLCQLTPFFAHLGGGWLELTERLPATPGLAEGEAVGPDLCPFSPSSAVPRTRSWRSPPFIRAKPGGRTGPDVLLLTCHCR